MWPKPWPLASWIDCNQNSSTVSRSSFIRSVTYEMQYFLPCNNTILLYYGSRLIQSEAISIREFSTRLSSVDKTWIKVNKRMMLKENIWYAICLIVNGKGMHSNLFLSFICTPVYNVIPYVNIPPLLDLFLKPWTLDECLPDWTSITCMTDKIGFDACQISF